MNKINVKILLLFFISLTAQAKLAVVTTTTDLKALVSEVGGEWITVDAIAKGTQDPHFIEAKPSYMTKTSHADLVVSIGLDLEVGWLPSILRGARNPKINPGEKGNLEVGPLLDPLEVAQGKISRSKGDVHPFGNPHVNLDPIRMGKAAVFIAERLGQLDPVHMTSFLEKAKALQRRFESKTKIWQTRIDKTKIKKIVTYHKTLTYFFDRFHLENPAILEPKPGIPPTSGHILEVIQVIKDQKIRLVMVENFFDSTVTHRLKEEVPFVRTADIPVDVDGEAQINNLDDLYEKLVQTLEGK